MHELIPDNARNRGSASSVMLASKIPPWPIASTVLATPSNANCFGRTGSYIALARPHFQACLTRLN